MNKGYLVMAQGKTYARQAEFLAKSIKDTQSCISRLSVITDCDVDSSLFDVVIRLEEDLAVNSNWKIENRIKFYDLTPYDETVILDADMLFLTDVSHWWKLFEKYELLLTNRVLTYKGTVIKHSPYRKTFISNDLPNVYSAFTYFKKTELTTEFFNLVKMIVLNWKEWTERYTPNNIQKFPSIDVAMSLAVKILGIESDVTSTVDYPTFTHMKGLCQGLKHSTESWEDIIGIYKNNKEIKLGPFTQSGVLHYVKKDFV